jgi:ZIP family zinc transporter
VHDHPTLLQLIGLGGLVGVLPVYLGIAAALVLFKGSKWAWQLVGLSTGILLYLFFDLMHESFESINTSSLTSWAVFIGSFALSFVGLLAADKYWQQTRKSASPGSLLPYTIAIGMGFHNLGEGLAVGTSYAQGHLALTQILVLGFALHNGTEGFAISGPAGGLKLDLKDFAVLGLLAGGPTVLGTVLSAHAVSPYLSLACYTIAAGSLLYVILSLFQLSYRRAHRMEAAVGLCLGIALMYATGAVLARMAGVEI